MTSLSEIEEQARLLIENGIERVVISLGKSGLLYVDEMTSFHYNPTKIEVVNTLECGDTEVAAYCIAEMKKLSVYDATKQAVALSAANATTYESGNIPIDTYEKLLLSN